MGETFCKRSPQLCWENISSCMVNFVEHMFYIIGTKVAESPWRTILLCWIFIGLSSLGFLRFHIEKNPMKLWVPQESDFAINTEWIIVKYGAGFRQQKVLVTAPDVLDPWVLPQLLELHERIQNLHVTVDGTMYKWSDLCFTVPVINLDTTETKVKRSPQRNEDFNDAFFTDNEEEQKRDFDPSVDIDPKNYCRILGNFRQECLQQNILDIWRYDSAIIKALSRDQIVSGLNETTTSPVLGHSLNYTAFLGGISMGKDHKIFSATALLMVWYAHVNFSTVNLDMAGNLAGTEDWVSEALYKWEGEFLNLLQDYGKNVQGIDLFYESGRSFGDISGATLFQDMDKLTIGIVLMFIYIQIVLSKFSWVGLRLTLGSVGLLSVGMAFITACGWAAFLGIPYGPVHTSLPFLLMGLGIDDMFVMKACWEQLSEDERRRSIPIQVGLMVKHAGVSIVITSFTDIVAFLIGAITVLPSLQSFCLYAALGVFFIFCFSVTFYVAIFTLDIHRIRSKRNGVLFCYKHEAHIETSYEPSWFQKLFAKFFKNIIFKTTTKILIVVLALAITGFSVPAVLQLEQRFDPVWFIPEETYLRQFIYQNEKYFPDDGYRANIFVGAIDYSEDFTKLYHLVHKFQNDTAIKNMDTWTDPFRDYVLANFNKDISIRTLSDSEFKNFLSKFLFSPQGARHQPKFRFEEPLLCGQPVPNITVSSIDFTFTSFDGPKQYIPAMNRVNSIAKNAGITTGDCTVFVWAKIYANWHTDEIIAKEVERNLELALLCVMGCTVILITNLQMCMWIFLCVAMTLINVCGTMYRFGMTIDIVSCIALELAIGLCVDYAAHVGHTFLTIKDGDRESRSLKTVSSIGTAVLYGGGSTLLSLSMLSRSQAYTFNSFFKIFLFVIVFGLFHGLLFLPVVLSLIGPSAYRKKSDKKSQPDDLAVENELVELAKQ